VGGLLAVATACAIHGVNKFIFSSTAAVYGLVATGIASESTPLAPISPYARSKLMAETILADLARASDLRFVALRYFNVAGADPLGRLGQGENANKHLIKAACEAALGSRDFLEIYGADYDTPDGTCVRDFIHVADLADAHLRAVDYLIEGGPTTVLNCGYGRGHSVLEVVAAVERVSGQPMRLRTSGRREGDPPMLIADASRIHATLGWMPKYADLDVVVGSAFNWERRCIEQRELAISDRTN
jgi:UDP-glucose 4-epimerase